MFDFFLFFCLNVVENQILFCQLYRKLFPKMCELAGWTERVCVFAIKEMLGKAIHYFSVLLDYIFCEYVEKYRTHCLIGN